MRVVLPTFSVRSVPLIYVHQGAAFTAVVARITPDDPTADTGTYSARIIAALQPVAGLEPSDFAAWGWLLGLRLAVIGAVKIGFLGYLMVVLRRADVRTLYREPAR